MRSNWNRLALAATLVAATLPSPSIELREESPADPSTAPPRNAPELSLGASPSESDSEFRQQSSPRLLDWCTTVGDFLDLPICEADVFSQRLGLPFSRRELDLVMLLLSEHEFTSEPKLLCTALEQLTMQELVAAAQCVHSQNYGDPDDMRGIVPANLANALAAVATQSEKSSSLWFPLSVSNDARSAFDRLRLEYRGRVFGPPRGGQMFR